MGIYPFSCQYPLYLPAPRTIKYIEDAHKIKVLSTVIATEEIVPTVQMLSFLRRPTKWNANKMLNAIFLKVLVRYNLTSDELGKVKYQYIADFSL